MEISKLLEELQRLNECLDACDTVVQCKELQIEKPIEFETQDIPQSEIKEPELAEEDVKDTVASKLLKQLADMNLEKEEPVETSVEKKNETIDTEAIFDLDDKIANIENQLFKLRQQIDKNPEDTELIQKRDELESILKGLNVKRDKKMDESKINEISQELVDKVLTQRKSNMDNAVNKYAKSLSLQRKRRQVPTEIEEPKTQLNIEQVPQENIEDDKALSAPLKDRLQKILDLGFMDVTGPKQKEKHIIMLQGEHSGRGYRIDNSGETCIASALNNFGPTSDGAYRYGKDMFRGDLADCLVWVYENAKKHLNRMLKKKNESKINEISQETVDAVRAEREKDVVKKTKEYKATGKEEDREIAKEAKDKLGKFNKLEKDWKKSKKLKESKKESKATLVAKFQEGNNTHQIIKNDGKYMIRYNVNEDKALSSYGPIDSLSVAIETLMKRCPKAEQVK